jgi:hypothetical protein
VSLLSFAEDILRKSKSADNTALEGWLLSKMQQRIAEVTAAMEEMKTRTALQVAFFCVRSPRSKRSME